MDTYTVMKFGGLENVAAEGGRNFASDPFLILGPDAKIHGFYQSPTRAGEVFRTMVNVRDEAHRAVNAMLTYTPPERLVMGGCIYMTYRLTPNEITEFECAANEIGGCDPL
ncbi:hypothetical protein HZB02_02055 [Candidatus Woesearchaeota archaeon]|nr:hypothetical protein [Candidatus Woesearchaeota archaeon]